MSKTENFYLCNPKKNRECSKNYCVHNGMGECFCTTDPYLSVDRHPLSDKEYKKLEKHFRQKEEHQNGR